MSIVFFSLQEVASLAGEGALAGTALATGAGLTYNAYRTSVHPYTSEERQALTDYKQADKNYGIGSRVRDSLPKLSYTPEGEAFVNAKSRREESIKARKERISPLNLKNAAILGGVLGAGYGIRMAGRPNRPKSLL